MVDQCGLFDDVAKGTFCAAEVAMPVHRGVQEVDGRVGLIKTNIFF